MVLTKRWNNLFFILLSLLNPVAAQVDAGFIEHLSENGLRTEHKLYLDQLPAISDSASYYKTKFNLKYFNDSLLLDHYHKSKILCDNDTLLLINTSAAFLIHSNKTKNDIWFSGLDRATKNSALQELHTVYQAALNPLLFQAEIFPAQAQSSFKKYKKVYRKKPFIAATLSTAVPGLGKLYAGKTNSFFMTFILNAAYAAQTAESAKKLGLRHAFTFINAGAFTVFYLSNIYGSYKAVKQLRKEYKKQFLTDVTRFYN